MLNYCIQAQYGLLFELLCPYIIMVFYIGGRTGSSRLLRDTNFSNIAQDETYMVERVPMYIIIPTLNQCSKSV